MTNTIRDATTVEAVSVLEEAILTGARALHASTHRATWEQASDATKIDLLATSRVVLDGAVEPLLDGLAVGAIDAILESGKYG